MRLNIRYKLLLALSLSSLLVIVIITAAFYIIIQRQFLDYRAQRDLQDTSALVERLAGEYRSNQGWHSFQQSPRRLGRLLKESFESQRPRRKGDKHRPPHERGPGHRPPPGRKPRPPKLLHRLSLLDNNHQRIAGYGKGSEIALPIEVDNQVVGYLAIEKPKRLEDKLDRRFVRSQVRSSVVAAVCALGIALILSILLARHFNQPIQRLANGMRRLSKGEYGGHIDIQRRDELGQLGQDFNYLSHSLEKNEQLRRQWVADTSHELRTPVAILQGEIEAVQDGIRQADETFIQSLAEEARHLGKLIDDLNTLAMSDAGALNYDMQPVDLNELLQSLVAQFSARAEKQQIDLHYEARDIPSIYGDTTRLNQLLTNLIENSLRYTNPQGSLHIQLTIQDHAAAIILEDTPPCPASDEIAQLFQRFYRTENSRNRSTGGSGLGLAICHNIVDAHQGTIRAYQAPAGGLGIAVSLPFEHSAK